MVIVDEANNIGKYLQYRPMQDKHKIYLSAKDDKSGFELLSLVG